MDIIEIPLCAAGLCGIGYLTVLGAGVALRRAHTALGNVVRAEASAGSSHSPASLAGRIARLMREHGDEWSVDEYVAKHNPTGLEIWIANGLSFVDIYRESRDSERHGGGCFSFLQKLQVWSAFRSMKGAIVEKQSAKVARRVTAAIDAHLASKNTDPV